MLTITPNQLNEYWFYSLTNAQGDIVFLGCERFPDIFTLSSILKLPDIPMNDPLTITLHSAHKRALDAKNARGLYIRNNLAGHTPVYNMMQGAIRGGAIRCDQTGLTYRTQTECAAALDISQGQLSKHLQRAPGYNSVKGFTFSYDNAQAIPARGESGTVIEPESLPDLSSLNDQDKAWFHVLHAIPEDARNEQQRAYWDYLQKVINNTVKVL